MTGVDGTFARRTLFRLRVTAVVCVPALLVGAIGQALHAPGPLNLAGVVVFSTGITGAAVTALLACWQPDRWVPGLRETVNRCCLFGLIPAAVLLGAGLASQTLIGGTRLTPAIGLAFLPATVLALGGFTLLYVSYRLHPEAHVTAFQGMKFYGRRAAQLRGEQEERARLNPYPTELGDWQRNGDGR